MRTADYQRLLERVSALPLEDQAKQVVLEDLRRDARENGITRLERADRVNFARLLLAQKVSRSVICARLMALYEVSRSQAYEDIAESLNCPERQQESGRDQR